VSCERFSNINVNRLLGPGFSMVDKIKQSSFTVLYYSYLQAYTGVFLIIVLGTFNKAYRLAWLP
jgi:hypothetical protein